MNKRLSIMVNVSNLKVGGGLQVADSICRELKNFSEHKFLVVYSKALSECAREIAKYENVETVEYEFPVDIWMIYSGRCDFMDKLVSEKGIDVVLTVFGPSIWKPMVPHISGFAYPHLVLPESPYWQLIPKYKLLLLKFRLFLKKLSFAKCSDNYFTENPFISERLNGLFPQKRVETITNNANQVFYHPEKWERNLKLSHFDGLTMLTVSANYPHKNIAIIIPTCHYLEERYPELSFRFVLTIDKEDLKGVDACALRHIVFLGPVKVQQVPYLYEQSDVMFLPTLLECFSASYSEAMVMHKPILTTNLNFAKGLCGDAALYYDALSPRALGEAIVRLCTNVDFRKELVTKGIEQEKRFDTFEQRARKLIKYIETL